MKEELLGTRPLPRVGLQTHVYKVLLVLVERLDRGLDELGRYRMRVAIAAELEIEHLFGRLEKILILNKILSERVF
jgi:hypothetical protein